MSNIIKSPYSKIFSSDYERVLQVEDEAMRAWNADSKDRERQWRNWKLYFAIEGDQWPADSKIKLENQNRQAAQYNIVGPKIDALTGSLVQESFDLDWKPMEGARNSNTEAIKGAYYSDKELCNYEKNIEAVIRDGLIQVGYMKIGMSNRYNPLKNISMKRLEPGYYVPDPTWISDDHFDCLKGWEFFYLNAERIAEKYDVMTPMIDQEIKNLRSYGGRYDELTNNPNEIAERNKIGHLYRIIEYHYIDIINTQRLSGQKMTTGTWINFPITKDHNKLEHFMTINQIDPMTILEFPYEDRIHKIETVCPEIVDEKMLDGGISTVQIKSLPYIPFTANRAYGKNKGIADDLYDIQQTINKRESKLTDLIATAQGGGKLVNKDLFDSPTEMQNFRKRANDPSYVEFVNGDEMTKERAITYINSNQFPNQIINQLMRMWDIVDRVSKVPAALEAISENANESGVLFERKLQVARINTITIVNRIRDFRKYLAEAYFEQYQIAYNGQERDFSTSDGKYNTKINERVFSPSEGKWYVKNRPDQMPRCTVICTESKSSPNKTIRDRAIYSELYNLSAQTNPEYANFFFRKILTSMELSQEDLNELGEIGVMQKIRDRNKLITENVSMDAQQKQAMFAGMEAQFGIAQLQAQMGPQQQQAPEALTAEEDIPVNEEPPTPLEELPPPGEEEVQPLVSDLA